jgi:hypothetical protein
MAGLEPKSSWIAPGERYQFSSDRNCVGKNNDKFQEATRSGIIVVPLVRGPKRRS